MKKFIYVSTVSLVSLLFSACGDDGSSSSANNAGTDISSSSVNNAETDFAFNVETSDELPNCREKMEGLDAYVKADNTVRLCRSERWLVLGESVANRDSLPNCTSVREGDRAFLEKERITLVCSDGKWTLFGVDDLEPESGGSVSAGSSSDMATSSSSSIIVTSSSSVAESSSSSSVAVSSSSVGESSSSSAMVVSCSEYKCVSTEYLNQELLEAGKYGYLVDTRDSQVYRTIEIGERTWMAQNLNYAYNQKTSSLDSSSFCNQYEPDGCAKYGRFYLWSAAMDSAEVFPSSGEKCGYGGICASLVRSVCPEGWHLPSREEFENLFDAVGGRVVAGKALKGSSGWSNGNNGPNDYGFSARPVGFVDNTGAVRNIGNDANFWYAPKNGSSDTATCVMQIADNEDYARFFNNQFYDVARSVRCVKDSN